MKKSKQNQKMRTTKKGNKINSQLKTIKRSKLIDIWVRPLSDLNLKIWIQDIDYDHSKPSITIGLGTKMRTESSKEMFSFAVLDENSVDWLINSINESIVIRDQYKNESLTESIIWKKQRILDSIRKISVTILVKKNAQDLLTTLMINSKTLQNTVLSDSDIQWILSTLEIAKYNLSEGAQ